MTQPASRVLLPQSNSSGNIANAASSTPPPDAAGMPSKLDLFGSPKKSKAKDLPAAGENRTHGHAHTESVITTPRQMKIRNSANDLAKSTNSNLATPGARIDHANASANAAANGKLAAPPNSQLPSEDSKGSWRSWTRGEGLQASEIEISNMPEVRRKANVCQLCEFRVPDVEHIGFWQSLHGLYARNSLFAHTLAWTIRSYTHSLSAPTDFLNHYFDNLRYLADRKERLQHFQMTTVPGSEGYAKDAASYFGRERALLRKRRTKLKLQQFHIITQVGQGGYGEVFLARKRETGQICALKKLRKRTLVKMDEVRHVLVERDILTATRTPWLVRLLYAFQDEEHVYLAMEYVPGGDFRTMLNNAGVLREEHARFYMSEMFVAVNEVHKLGYIHRDLKPENFLIDISGHIKLTDFGLAAGALNPGRIESLRHRLDKVKDTDFVYRTPAERGSLYKAFRAGNPHYADSVVGSPDYMAPEVLRGKSYGYSVDYWSLGCMLFEFLCGFPPFSGGSPEETWANLKNWKRVLNRPVYTKKEDLQFNLSDVAWDSIVRLIDTPERRYGSLDQVQSHPFFAPLDFKLLRGSPSAGAPTPPFVPQLQNELDTYYFDDFENPEDMAKYKEVQEKQRNVENVREKGGSKANGGRGMWAGFTFGKNGVGPNGRSVPANPGGDELVDAFQTMF